MAVLYPVRKARPACRPMTYVRDEAVEGRLRYVCAKCDDDLLHDPAARKWTESPLRPPAK